MFCYLLPVVLFGIFAWFQPEINAQKYELNNLALRDESRYYGFPWIKNTSAFDFGDSYVKSLKEEHPIYNDYDIKGCLNTYFLRYQLGNTFQVVSSRNEVYLTNDSILYLPRLTLIDTSIFAKIYSGSFRFFREVEVNSLKNHFRSVIFFPKRMISINFFASYLCRFVVVIY